MEKLYYIQNMGYCGNALFWWPQDRCGYTIDIRKAGKFTEEEARSICRREEDKAWPVEYIDEALGSQKLIIDHQLLDYSERMNFKAKK